jgi:hypothetical protein
MRGVLPGVSGEPPVPGRMELGLHEGGGAQPADTPAEPGGTGPAGGPGEPGPPADPPVEARLAGLEASVGALRAAVRSLLRAVDALQRKVEGKPPRTP